jgi:ubiquinone biosynthesis protein
MGISLRPEHLRRYKDLAVLLRRYGGEDFVRNAGLSDTLDPEEVGEVEPKAEQLAADLEELGPTYVKLGQLLSTRSDLLPVEYLQALNRLQDDVDPIPFADVAEVFAAEFGVRLSRAFSEVDPDPIGSASLAQVHRGVLRSGRAVALKVQRPGIRERIATDLDVLGDIAELLDQHTETGKHYQFAELHAEFRKSLVRELDFSLEARNLSELGQILASFDRILVPRPVPDFTSARVVTMDYIDGRNITDLGGLAHLELEGTALTDQLVRAYLEQILVHGFFHADPHPGNVLLTREGELALIDVGMTARLTTSMQERMVRLLVAIGDGEPDAVAEAVIKLATASRDYDRQRFTNDVAELLGRVSGRDFEGLEVGPLVAQVSRISVEHGLRPPPELALLGKTLMNLDEIARTLAPDYDPNRAVRDNAAEILSKRLWRETSASSAMNAFMDTKDLITELPGRLNRIMDTVAEGKLSVQVDAVDEHELMRAFQKVANRVTTGVILAAMIIGASMLMQVETDTTILGYPALAIVLFLAAAAAGAVLVVSILVGDQHGAKLKRGKRT